MGLRTFARLLWLLECCWWLYMVAMVLLGV